MVNNTAIKQLNEVSAEIDNNSFSNISNIKNTNNSEICYFKEKIGDKKLDGSFLWTKDIQGLILSAYFYGYILLEVIFKLQVFFSYHKN